MKAYDSEFMPNIQANFVLFGEIKDEKGLNIITRKIGINPTDTRLIMDLPQGDRRRLYLKDDWEISIIRERAFCISNQLNIILIMLSEKRDIIKELQKAFSLETFIGLSIHTNRTEGYPKMVFSREFIELAAYLNARVGIDHYRY